MFLLQLEKLLVGAKIGQNAINSAYLNRTLNLPPKQVKRERERERERERDTNLWVSICFFYVERISGLIFHPKLKLRLISR